jgi:multidrug efflux system membrane fusion protein
MKKILVSSIALLCGSLLLFSAGCGKTPEVKAPPVVPVLAEKAVTKDMPLAIRTFGNAEAYSEVAIKVLVTGTIKNICIKPGEYVKKGEVLVEMDTRSYEATMKQLEAVYNRDDAIYQDTNRQAETKERLFKSGVATNDDTKKMRALAESLKASVAAAAANVEKAKLDVEYCTIRAPIDGRVGDFITNEGAVIKANDAAIMNISETRPIYVTFSVPQTYLPQIQKFMKIGKLIVTAKVPGDDGISADGELSFIDNSVNMTTGTIKLKATFDNADNLLWPGQFVDVTLNLSVDKNRVVVPAHAIQAGHEGSYVFVINNDKIAMRMVKIERFAGKEAIIASGIKDGEMVVTDGHLRLYPDAKVVVKSGLTPVESNSDKK